MAGFNGKFESAKQDWETPASFFNPINDEFHFTLDAAANAENTKVPGSYIDEEHNALHCTWGNHVAWLNPPYGSGGENRLGNWVKKAYDESLKGTTVVMLIPARTNTNWFHDYCLKGEVRFVRGRPKFGDAKHGLPQPLCLIVFRPPSASFTSRFGSTPTPA